MKSYAVSGSETDQGYVKDYTYKDAEDSDGAFYICFLTIAISVSILLILRLCFRVIGDMIDGMVQMVVKSIVAISPEPRPSPQMNINDVESNNTADDATESDNTATIAASSEESDKYLTIISRREYIATYALFVIAFTVYDTILYSNQTGIQTENWNYFPIPSQIIASTFGTIVFLIQNGVLYMIICKKCNHTEIKQHCLKHWEEWAAIPFLTVLTNYILVHVFWILLLLISFPALVALKGVFLIPLSLPVIIVLQRIFSCFKICCRCRCHQISFDDFMTYFYAAIYILLFWIPLLILLYHFSNYLLNSSEISNDPLKLIIVLAGAIFFTYRLAKVWGHEFFFERRQRRHVDTRLTRESETTPFLTNNNNNYNAV